MQLKNYAAWIEQEKGPISVAPAPLPKCGPEDLLIRNHVVAINPVDWKIQSFGGFSLQYPTILGEDAAGEILEVGSNLRNRFQVGQRVMAHTMGLNKGNTYGGFQLYPILSAETTSAIPDDISYSEAAVLPLSISTAAAGLFMKSKLGLNYPKTGYLRHSLPVTNMDDGEAAPTPTLLLWGGSSSVGSTVIQLASAAGYSIITTASSSNHDYCKDLGAAHTVDYHNPDAISILISLFRGRNIVGAYDAIGSDTTVHQCAAILHALGGGKIASVGAAPDDLFGNVSVVRMSAAQIVSEEPEVGEKVWGEYVPGALRSGGLVTSPKALVVGKGLDNVQKGLDRLKRGVSARKVEVVLV